jgi:Pentapeptide repeats (8 copies)
LMCPRLVSMDLGGLLCKAIRRTKLHSRPLKVTMTRHVTFGLGLAIRSPRPQKEPTVMRPICRSLSVVLLAGCFVTAVAVAGERRCEGPYKGLRLTPEELATVLRNHQAWLKSKREPTDERRANLCQADLQKARLDGANLQKSSLHGSNLQEANLTKANLQGASLAGANLQGASLAGANLQTASL